MNVYLPVSHEINRRTVVLKFLPLQECTYRIMPEIQGHLKNNDLARSWKFLFLGRLRSEDISLQFNAPFHSLHKRRFMSLYVLPDVNGKIPFLDCLVTRDNNNLKTTSYRKPTHTDRLLDQSTSATTLRLT